MFLLIQLSRYCSWRDDFLCLATIQGGHLKRSLLWQLPLLATWTVKYLYLATELSIISVGTWTINYLLTFTALCHLTLQLYLLATWPDSWVCWPLDLTVASVDHFNWQLPLLLNELIAASVGHVNWPSLFSQLFGTNPLFLPIPSFLQRVPTIWQVQT